MTRWTQPRVWHNGETVTAAWFNIYNENLEFLKDRERVHVYHSQNEELKNEEWELSRWDSDANDNNEMHTNHRIPRHFNEPWSDAKNGSRDGNWPDSATKKSGRINFNNGGLYLVSLVVSFDDNATGKRKVRIRKNSNEQISGGHGLTGDIVVDATSSGQTIVTADCVAVFDRNDHVNSFVYQSSGDKLDVVSGKTQTFMQVIQLSG